MHNRTIRALGSTVLVLAVGLGAVACGNDDDTRSAVEASATEHNDADVAFASEMLQHNAQALSMVDLTFERPLDPRILELTDEVRAVQGPEIEAFSDWLTEWDEEIPATMRDHSNAAEDGGSISESMVGMDTTLPGMLTAEDILALEEAPDVEFERMWLEMMIEHHTGAIEMAKSHIGTGQYKPVIDLAEDIVETQTAQIEALRSLSNP